MWIIKQIQCIKGERKAHPAHLIFTQSNHSTEATCQKPCRCNFFRILSAHGHLTKYEHVYKGIKKCTMTVRILPTRQGSFGGSKTWALCALACFLVLFECHVDFFPSSHLTFLGGFLGGNWWRVIRWRVRWMVRRNGWLALIKAYCSAGFAHHNLRMDYTAVMWVTIFSNSAG